MLFIALRLWRVPQNYYINQDTQNTKKRRVSFLGVYSVSQNRWYKILINIYMGPITYSFRDPYNITDISMFYPSVVVNLMMFSNTDGEEIEISPPP